MIQNGVHGLGYFFLALWGIPLVIFFLGFLGGYWLKSYKVKKKYSLLTKEDL